jgi:WD40 repeat protein
MRTRPMLSLVCLLLLASHAFAQQPQSCPPIQLSTPEPSKLIISPQQEMYFGEIAAEHLESQFLVVDDDDVDSYLRRVGNRVTSQLPKSDLQYQFFLYEQPEIQAFGLPGGRIYVSRKMIAFLKNEDELAVLLGHEIGHLASKQQNSEISRQMRDILGVQSLGDREDVYEKYNELVEAARLKKTHRVDRADSDRDQMIADRVGIEVIARAGYSPQASIEFMDRLLQTKGKTGSWLTDLFGATKPDARRLREVLKDVGSLPASCIDSRPVGSPADFHKWQADVLNYRGIGHKENLHNVLYQKKLNDPLRGDIENFRFSPDGKYVLAQDDGGIFVLTREPFQMKFRFDAVNAEAAHFSPDSRQIVFATRDLRVESWDVESQERVSISDVAAIHGCRESDLSPDGKFLACLSPDFSLGVFDVAAAREVFHKDSFIEFSGLNSISFYLEAVFKMISGEGIATLRFSPDGHYFAAAALGSDGIFVELPEGKKLNIPGNARTPLKRSFDFLSPDTLVGLDPYNPQKSPIVNFHSGEIIGHVILGGGSVTAATNPRYLLIRPIKDHRLGALDLQTQKIIFASRSSASDIWSDTSVSERLDGEIGLYKMGEPKPFALVQLPLGHLGRLQTYAVSPDLHWMAASLHTRGSIWDLDTNQRIFYLRGYERAFSVSPEVFYLQLPKFEKVGPELLAFSGATHQSAARNLDEKDDLVLRGKYAVRWKHEEKERDRMRNVTLDIIDTEKGQTLWSRSFPKRAPWLEGENSAGRLILMWPANSDTAKEEISANPALREKWQHKNVSDNDYLLEVLEATTGKPIGSIVVSTGRGSFHIEHAESVGDWIVASDSSNRVLLYSLSTGETKARLFGSRPVFSPSGNLLCLANDRGQLRLFNLHSLAQVDALSFPSRVVLKAFSGDANKLLALTDDQTVYVMDLSKLPAANSPAAAIQ